MTLRRILAASLLLVTASSAALAAATDEEAARITTSLQAYLGKEPGVVKVEPKGDDYIVTLDAAPYIAKIQTPGIKMNVDPVVLTIRPKGNGQWDVAQKGSFNFGWDAEGFSTVTAKVAEQDWTGVFDEASAAFLSSTYSIKNMSINQVMTDPTTKAKTTASSVYDTWSGNSTATPRPDGSVDATSNISISNVVSTSSTDMPGGQPLAYTINAGKTDSTATAKGLRSKAILDLLAWFVEHPSKDLIIKDQQQLKDKILAALPLWESLESSSAMNNMAVTTGIGNFALPAANVSVGLSGASKEGRLREAFGVTGFALPPGISPPWTEGLIPSTMKIDFTLDGVDLESPVKLFLTQADLSKDPVIPAGSEMAYMAAFAPNNSMKITLADGEFTSPTYSLTYEGAFNVNFMGLPTGTATIKMKGLDDVIAKVQAAAATDPTAQQAMGGLVAFKGFGKAEADGTTTWAIDLTQPGKLLVNGIDLSAMAGMAPPPAPAQ